MKLDRFFDNFSLMADAPNGVQKLREMVLQLAVQGKLVPQDPKDEPASVLLEKIKAEKERLVKEKKIKKPKPLPPIQPDEVLYELPNGWEWVRLGVMGFTQTGTTPSKSNPAYFGKYIPFIKPSDISANSVNYENEGLSKQGLNQGRLIESNSVLMVCIGGSIGKVNVIERPCSCNQQINTIIPYADILYTLLNFFMRSPYFQKEVVSRAPKTTLPIISKGKWELIPTPLPPANEQKRIVAKVDELMALCNELEARKQQVNINCIQLNDASIHKLLAAREPKKFNKHWQRICDYFDLLYSKPENVATLRQAILQLAVQGKLVPQDPKDEPASVSLEKLKSKSVELEFKVDNQSIVQVPKTWSWCLIGDVVETTQGVQIPKSDQKPAYEEGYVRYYYISDFKNDHRLKFVRDIYPHKLITEDDLIVVNTGATSGEIFEGRQGVLSNNLFKVAFDKRFLFKTYLYFFIKSNLFKAHQAKLAKGGANPHMGHKNFNSTPFPLPPYNEQKRIVTKIEVLMAICDELEASLSKSQTDCDRLMEAAVAGIMAA